MSERHCETCICGRRAPVQGNRHLPAGQPGHGPGTVAWAEHLLAWGGYASQYGRGQSAETMAHRGGFSFGELTEYLGRPPSTWEPGR